MFTQQWLSNLNALAQSIRDLLPAILAAAALLLVGLVLGRLLRSLSRRLTASALERLSRSATLGSALERTDVTNTVPSMVGLFVFWLVFLFFAASALESLGLPVITNSLSRFVYYLPNVLAAALIVAAGAVVGRVVRGTVTAAAVSAGVAIGPALGRLADGAILLLAIVVSLEELGIDSSALVVMLTVVFGSALAATGLAFGLGARTSVSNIIAAHYLRRSYQVGQTVRIEGAEGRIVQTTPTAVLLETDKGKLMVPAKKFAEETSLLVTEVR